ncbi:MAG: ROK family protein [Cyanobacteria bacterium NC_groundwater_1444_Ag_S-0.65um_54_12]|nr:ROK family protein [Cyanobacteria bacterium NC_groundwater_1444_Ag_S-0.65um_54_12]
MYHLIGIELGGSKLSAGLTDTDCCLVRKLVEPIADPPNVLAVLDATAAMAWRIVEDLPYNAILALGVACSGLINRPEGIILSSPSLGWHNVALRDELERRLPWKVFIGNNVNLATLGEWQQGAGSGAASLLGIFIGTGIGAGLILNGQLYEGGHGFAGEIGHSWLALCDHPADACQETITGKLLAAAAGPALSRQAMQASQSGEATLLVPDATGWITCEEIGRVESLGDAVAKRLITDAAGALGLVIANAVVLLDPERIILGGSVVRAIPALIPQVQQIVQRHVMPEFAARQEIVAAKLGREASLIGAAVLARMAGELSKKS